MKFSTLTKAPQQGVTLLELMVTVAILGIISAIAVPNYTSYIGRTRFADGKEDVYRVLAQQERYFMNNMKYTINLGDGGIGYAVGAGGNLTSPEGHYLLSAGNCTDQGNVNSCVRITATGQGKEAGTTLYLQSDGDKSANIL